MMNQWHYSQDGAQYGPTDEAEIIRLIQSGELSPSTPVCKEGGMDWQPARNHACFKVEIYPGKKAPTKAAAAATSKPVSGRASQSPRKTAAATPSPSVSFAPKVTNPVVTPVPSGKSSISGATIACLIIMSIISIGSIYFSVSQDRKVNELELLKRLADDSKKDLLDRKNELGRQLADAKTQLADAKTQKFKAEARAKDFKAKNDELRETEGGWPRKLLDLEGKVNILKSDKIALMKELEDWKETAKEVPRPAPDPELAQICFVRGNSFYLGTDDVVKNHSEALKWFHKAAYMGNAEAQYNLGEMYRNGEGVKKDFREAAKQYDLAAAQGHTEAEYRVGVMSEIGQGFVKNDKNAVEWYRKAAEKKDANAQNNLGFMYEKGKGVRKNDSLAVEWYRKAAEQENAMAHNNLGAMYEKGKGVEQDFKEALKWWRKAAEQENAMAQFNIGAMYKKGKGVVVDVKEAMKWYRKAGEQGDAKAQFNIGAMYKNEGKLLRAYAWYFHAAKNGDDDGKNAMAVLRKQLSEPQIISAKKYAHTLE